MKKTLLLNSVLSELIASLGHSDMVVIGDAGLPIPPEPRRIDLALCCGIPPFLETVRVIVSEMQVEKALIATETGQRSPHIRDGLGQRWNSGHNCRFVYHRDAGKWVESAWGTVVQPAGHQRFNLYRCGNDDGGN
jgi:D-ribose pyranose/furanose isomerase RbsD